MKTLRLGLVMQRRTCVSLNIPPASAYAVFREEPST